MKKNHFLAVCTLLLAFGAAGNASAVMLTFDPDPVNAVLGNSVEVGVKISELGNGVAPSLGTFDFDIGFDSSVLAFSSAVFGDPTLGNQLDLDILGLGFGSVNGATPAVGSVNLFEVSIDPEEDLNSFQADEFILAVLTFDTLSVGSTLLDITFGAFGGLGDASGAPLPVDSIDPGLVVVAPVDGTVPEPSALLLVVVGLLGIGMVTRRELVRTADVQ